ncbi:MAG: hypothetical protein WCK43_05680 [bacterium]
MSSFFLGTDIAYYLVGFMETLALSKSLRKRIVLESTLLLVAACNQTPKQASLSFDSEKVPSVSQSAPSQEKNSSFSESLFSKEAPKSKTAKAIINKTESIPEIFASAQGYWTSTCRGFPSKGTTLRSENDVLLIEETTATLFNFSFQNTKNCEFLDENGKLIPERIKNIDKLQFNIETLAGDSERNQALAQDLIGENIPSPTNVLLMDAVLLPLGSGKKGKILFELYEEVKSNDSDKLMQKRAGFRLKIDEWTTILPKRMGEEQQDHIKDELLDFAKENKLIERQTPYTNKVALELSNPHMIGYIKNNLKN